MFDFSSEFDLGLTNFWFRHSNRKYRGRGTLLWRPSDGFRLEGLIDDVSPKPDHLTLGAAPRFVPRATVDMKIAHYGRAIAPRALAAIDEEVDWNKRAAGDLPSVIIRTDSFGTSENAWVGSATCETADLLPLSDTVATEIRIAGEAFSTGHAMEGILHTGDHGERIIGRMTDNRHLELFWSLPKAHWSRSESWRLPESAADALSILLGQTVRLIRREMDFSICNLLEVRSRRELHRLDFLSPFTNWHRLDKPAFLKLTEYLARQRPNARICRQIFHVMANAARADIWDTKEFLLGTLLERVLRTIDNNPYDPSNNTWDLNKSMTRFRAEYLTDDWEAVCEDAKRARKRLRERNAHPDWLRGRGASLSPNRLSESLVDLQFLSRFYGYMILALAGIKGLHPDFSGAEPLVRSGKKQKE